MEVSRHRIGGILPNGKRENCPRWGKKTVYKAEKTTAYKIPSHKKQVISHRYSAFTLTWRIVNDFQVEFFSFKLSKTMEIECL